MDTLLTILNTIPLTGIDSSKKFFMIAAGVCLFLMIIFIILKFKNRG